MRKTRDFKQFLREKYENGQAQIRHPDPELRRRQEIVKFWTAMKYDTFKAKVKREFAAWLQAAEAQAPRAPIGARVTEINQVRKGDFLKHLTTKFRVLTVTPQNIFAVEVDKYGHPRNHRELLNRQKLSRIQVTRIERPQRQDVSLDTALGYMDRYEQPPRGVNNQQEYANWINEKLTQGGAPFERLEKDEARHQEQLKRHITEILEDRDIEEDWSWTPPAPVQIGQQVKDIAQLKVGDFVEHMGRKLRVIQVQDDAVKVVSIVGEGLPVPISGGQEIRQQDLQQNPAFLAEAIERPDVSFDKFKEYADKKFRYPSKHITTQAQYREWLEAGLKTGTRSPYLNLLPDEIELQNALEKQIKKLLKERGVGADWEWEKPPEAKIGERVQDGRNLRPGHFLKLMSIRARILKIEDDGAFTAVYLDDEGRPEGRVHSILARDIQLMPWTRIDAIKRPEVPWSKFKEIADHVFPYPERTVTNKEKYQRWLQHHLTKHPDSPYYQLGENEPELKKTLEEHVDKLLEDRKVGDDWSWTPPPLIKFPVDTDWKAKHQELLDVAVQGQKTGRDSPLGHETANGPIRRMMQDGDSKQEFVFKSKYKEPGQPGSPHDTLNNKTGVPSGEMHSREQGAYQIDRLLGDGVITPATVSAGDTEVTDSDQLKSGEGVGSYQAWIPGLRLFDEVNEGASSEDSVAFKGMSNADFLRHPDVGRMIVLDALTGNQDRHGGNLGYSWKDPNKPKTIENLRFHAIDNGFSLAKTVTSSHEDQKPRNWDIRDVWHYSGKPRETLVQDYFKDMPQDMRDRLKKIETKDLAKTLIDSGLKDPSVLESAAVRLAVLKDNPEALEFLIKRATSVWGQKEFQYRSHHEAKELLQDHTDLDDSAFDDIKKDVAAALAK